jgi:hypothetical protein
MSTLAPSYAISFTFTLDGKTRLFGKINSYCHSSEDNGQIDVYISKLLVKWLNYARQADPNLPETPNLRVGVLSISPIICPADAMFICDTSTMEQSAFDFYYDTWMGRGFLFGKEVPVVW